MADGGAIAGGFLGALTADEIDDISAAGRRRVFKRGTTLFNEGDRSEKVVVVLDGRIKVSYFTDDGKEVLLAIRERGDIVGDLSALDGEPHSASATAMEDVTALLVSTESFKAFLRDHPRVALFLLEVLSRRLRDADAKRVEFSTYDTIGRVARRLVELADRYGEASSSGLQISVPLSQEELASWAGCSREAASKALQALRKRGWVTTHRRRITILDLDAVTRRAS